MIRRSLNRLLADAPRSLSPALRDVVACWVAEQSVPLPTLRDALDGQMHQREVDTVLATVASAHRRGVLRELTESGANERVDVWKRLLKAAQFHGIESRSVLSGRGLSRAHEVSLDTLRVTAGIVPLSERRRLSDGRGVLLVLRVISEIEAHVSVNLGERELEPVKEDGDEVGATTWQADVIREALIALEACAVTLDPIVLANTVTALFQLVPTESEDTLYLEITDASVRIMQKRSVPPVKSISVVVTTAALRSLNENINSPRSCAVDLIKSFLGHGWRIPLVEKEFDELMAVVSEAESLFASPPTDEEPDHRVLFAHMRLRCARLSESVSASDFVALYEDLVNEHGKNVEFSLELSLWLAADAANLEEAVTEVKGVVALLAQVSVGSLVPRDDVTYVHQQLVEALCDQYSVVASNPGADDDASARNGASAFLDTAYNMIIAHKYHGLRITADLIRPLTQVLSKLGDCRVFNLVDLCTLFGENTIDMDIFEHLIRACRVAGDHHRAKTMVGLLRDDVAGLHSKLSAEAMEDLRQLKVLPPLPVHIFSNPFQPFDFEKAAKLPGRTASAQGSGS